METRNNYTNPSLQVKICALIFSTWHLVSFTAAAPLTVSTMNPIYGPISIENVIAYLKNNVTQNELEKLILLEFREIPTKSDHHSATDDADSAIIPIMGGILQKISRDMPGFYVSFWHICQI